MKRLFIVLCGTLMIGLTAFADEPITDANWKNHPQVLEVRMLYKSIKADIKANKLRRHERKFDCSLIVDDTNHAADYEGDIRVLYTNQAGKPRYYYHEGGSEDSMVQMELYYDENGRLRFAFMQGGAVNDTKIERRIYFSKSGVKIWEQDKILQGPGYPFVDWGVVDDPVKEFNAKGSCPEIKLHSKTK